MSHATIIFKDLSGCGTLEDKEPARRWRPLKFLESSELVVDILRAPHGPLRRKAKGD